MSEGSVEARARHNFVWLCEEIVPWGYWRVVAKDRATLGALVEGPRRSDGGVVLRIQIQAVMLLDECWVVTRLRALRAPRSESKMRRSDGSVGLWAPYGRLGNCV